MPKDILIHVGVAEISVAVVSDGELERYWQEQTLDGPGGDSEGRVGDVVLGRVRSVLPSMEAAFVDIGTSRSGFLSARDLGPRQRDNGGPLPREGDAVLVQIVKEPIADKGARLSGHIAIPGRYLVFVAEGSGISVSRRIEDEAERARLMSVMDDIARRTGANSGYIVRTAAIGATAAALQEDAARLFRIWRGIVAARDAAEPPATLHRDSGIVERALRDMAGANLRNVLIDDVETADAARAYAADAAPGLAARIEHYRGVSPLFEAFGIEDEIAALASARVRLPSGGWITIETTEALTAIDVNSGRHVAGGGFEDVSLAVNLEAAGQIARQLSLREIGGLMVVDFIHLSRAGDIECLMDELRAALARDRTPAEAAAMSEFGLVAITRKRERDPLGLRQSEPCAACDGHGRRRTAAAVALEILRRAERAAAAAPGKSITAFAASDVADWLLEHARAIAPGLTRRGATHWHVIAEPARARESFSLETEP
jgi:ribonuclease G